MVCKKYFVNAFQRHQLITCVGRDGQRDSRARRHGLQIRANDGSAYAASCSATDNDSVERRYDRQCDGIEGADGCIRSAGSERFLGQVWVLLSPTSLSTVERYPNQ